MKNILLLLLVCFAFSCKKDSSPVKNHLVKVEITNSSNNKNGSVYQYDSQGRITTIADYINAELAATKASISYNGNEATINFTGPHDPYYSSVINTIKLTLDGDRKAVKRIQSIESVATFSGNTVERRFQTDTTNYTYNTAGLLTQTAQRRTDSIWSNSGDTRASLYITTGTYTNTNGDITHIDEMTNAQVTIRNGGTPTITLATYQETADYSYTEQYPNKTDFANTAIINEFSHVLYEAPLNSNYKHLPGASTLSSIDRDGSGTITFQGHGGQQFIRSYNDKGLLSLVTSDLSAYQKTEYFYGK